MILLTGLDDGTTNKSRKGTLRNTDSFFKDDSVETRKINLTPSLLRDDSSGARLSTNESKEVSNSSHIIRSRLMSAYVAKDASKSRIS